MAVIISADTLSGGAGLWRFRPVTVVANAYVLGSVGLTITDLIEQTPIQLSDDGSMKMSTGILQDNSTLETFLKTYRYKKAGTSTTTPEIKMVENTRQYQVVGSAGGGAGDTQLLAAEFYGAVQGSLRKICVSIGHLMASSGSYTQAGMKFNTPILNWESVPADYALVWAPGSLASTATYGVDASATVTLAAADHANITFLTKA